ncbi:hypothetical protein RUMOBE_02789 [Blautia obeum ATCC 29174]|uniref:Uncharacterized protein n=1 Tax=Blautia obeum ATCC 29174 TaxID=411459 RepID=A5ZUV5_9FIRM|nr:hypothetical protein RUMOBE_02789 [Blautia obeum ATCC 29174]
MCEREEDFRNSISRSNLEILNVWCSITQQKM